ncbi:MAG: N-acetylmuramoyl-L-alanine amidase [Lachnospiraceae bacterium]
MIKWNTGWQIAGVMLAAGLMMTGCQSGKYQKIAVEEESSAAISQEADAEMQAVNVNQVESSSMQAERTNETVLSMEARDEIVYATTNLNVRAAPTTSAAQVGRLKPGEEVRRIAYNEEWSKIIYQENTYYAASRYLTTTKLEETQAAAETSSSSSEGREEVKLNPDWTYAGFSKINTGAAVLYRSEAANRNGKVICVNAGHGTKGGSSVKTQCHPDGTPKVTGGTTAAGATTAVAVSGGMQFNDGTAEAKVTLSMALVLKEKLLARGYDVLMIRETDDVQLDNIARTVIANNKADCHIALHWDSTTSDKGAFYMSVPNVSSYRNMEPVASNWQKHHALGDSLIAGLRGAGVKIFSGGSMEMDLTQTSYSTIASVDLELGDKASDYSASTLDKLGNGVADGIDQYFGIQ